MEQENTNAIIGTARPSSCLPANARLLLRNFGSSLFAFMRSTRQIAPSTQNFELSDVAKCSATYDEYVQSNKRVGNRWCWAMASHNHTDFSLDGLLSAYF